ncbi:MAG: hypothetical protein ACR2OC_08375 [Solirubrobacterales bacterium]
MDGRDTTQDEPERFERLAPDWLRIQVTPPTLAAGSQQAAELELLGEQQRRGIEGVFDSEALDGLAASGWLRQDVQARGSYLSTSGLRATHDHPELVMLNVPSAAVGWAASVFEAMACYLDRGDACFESGETFIDLSPAGAGAFTFAELSSEAAASIGFDELAEELLLVVPLP